MRNRFSNFHIIFNTLGSLLIILGFFLVIPLAVSWLYGEDMSTSMPLAFGVPMLLSFLLGITLRIVFRKGNPSVTQAMLICTLSWVIYSAIGGLPFVIGIRTSFLNGFFEAMSGFTTTGITMFTGLDHMSKGLLFWRGLTQWIGGLGILTLFLTVIYRGGGTHQLFGAETHKIATDRPVPGLANTLKILWAIYAGFTFLIAGALFVAGMPIFDSICHSFTALSTGGFSPYDASIAHYQVSGFSHYIWMEYILIFGMILGGTNFLIHYRVLTGKFRALYDNTEMRYWWFLIGAFVLVILLERIIKLQVLPSVSIASPDFWKQLELNFRAVFFQVVSIITTTGFGTVDIGTDFFGQVARQLFLVMMVIGGCVGSTGGGIKVLRISILMRLIRREIFRLRTPPESVSPVIMDKKSLHANEIYRVSGLFFAWIILLIIGGGITALLSNLGAYESFSGMFSALGNIGPCYISVEAMGQLHPVIKLVYIFGMLAGRLEILPVFLIFSYRAWQA